MNQFKFTPIQTDSKYTICSGPDNSCYAVNTKLELRVTFHIDIDVIILKETPIDRRYH